MGNKIKYFQFKDSCSISIFSYHPYKKYINLYFQPVNKPQDADVLILQTPASLYTGKYAKQLRKLSRTIKNVFIVCEEPVWNKNTENWTSYLLEEVYVDVKKQRYNISAINLNYITSDIFGYNTIPYFITTNFRYISNYKSAWKQLTELNKSNNLTLANRESKYNITGLISIPNSERWVYKKIDSFPYLANARHLIAESAIKTTNDCFFAGRGWQSGTLGKTIYEEQESANWHTDKLNWATTHSRFLFAIENINMPGYVTEKIFDAIFSNSIPIYYMNETEYFYDKIKGINLYHYDLERMTTDAEYCKAVFENDINYDEVVLHNFKFAGEFIENIKCNLDVELNARVEKLYESIKLEIK